MWVNGPVCQFPLRNLFQFDSISSSTVCSVSYHSIRLIECNVPSSSSILLKRWVHVCVSKLILLTPPAIQIQMQPTVVFKAPETLSKSKRQSLTAANAGKSKRHSHRMLAASPLITSQRPTNFSTITEEEEQQSKAAASAGNAKSNGAPKDTN